MENTREVFLKDIKVKESQFRFFYTKNRGGISSIIIKDANSENVIEVPRNLFSHFARTFIIDNED